MFPNWQKPLAILLLASSLSACSSSVTISEDELDIAAWKADKNGCTSRRGELLADFLKVSERLDGLREQDIKRLLGKPDGVELYQRNQKFFLYFLESGRQCPDVAVGRYGRHVRIRFDAINRVNEVFVEDAR